MEHLLTESRDILDDDGRVTEAGYALTPLLNYDRSEIVTSKLRIKEWDYYMVCGGDYAVAFTLSDHYYMALNTIGVVKFRGEGKFARTLREIELFPMGKYGFPQPGERRELKFDGKKLSLRYQPADRGMIISGKADNFFGSRLEACFRLSDYPRDNMVILTPFKDRRYFYYNLKTNCIAAEGYLLLGGRRVDFHQGAAAVYDCGRGAWTMRNRWYWATSSLREGERNIGFNLGYGFGDTSAASENMLFLNGIAHKLGRVSISVPTDESGRENCMGGDWTIADAEGRLSLKFIPSVVRVDNVRAAFVYSKQRQTFGRYVGYVIDDDGSRVDVDQYGSCEIFDNNG